MHQLPVTTDRKQKETKIILQIVKNNGFPSTNNKIKQKLTDSNHPQTYASKTWTSFTYHSPLIRQVMNIFKNMNIKISFCTSNTVYKLEHTKQNEQHKYQSSGIYNIKCLTCNKAYVGQTRRNLKLRFCKHITYIKTNNPQSAYALHVINHCHQCGSIEETMELLSPTRKSTCMNCLESYYIQMYQQKCLLIDEQNIGEIKPLYNIVHEIPSQCTCVKT
jgi:hypothetical protein